MLARCDPTPESDTPWDLARKIYDQEFRSNLAKQFQFELSDEDAHTSLVRIAFQYIYGRRCEGESEKYIKPQRQEYVRLRKAVREFRDHVTGFQSDIDDITHDIFHAAQALGEPKPETEFPELTEHEKKRGEPFYLELLRLLTLLERGTDFRIERLSSKGGRAKNNLGLSIAMPRIADFWIEKASGKFTVDYHKGSGVSDAFKFCKSLIEPLDTIPDTQIVTAIRWEINQRSEMRKRVISLDDFLTETPPDF